MAGDYHFSPEREEAIEKTNNELKEESKKYNSEAFTANKSAKTGLLMGLSTFESMYETLCYNLATQAITDPLISKVRAWLLKHTSEKFVNKFIEQAEKLRDGEITTEEFLNTTQKYGELANKYFVDNNKTEDYVNKTLDKSIENVDKAAGTKWVENAAKEVGDSKIGALTKSVEAIQPGVTTNHIKNVGSMLEDYVNTPEIANWLTKEGYDVDKLKQVAKLIGESHDDGKALILLEDIESSKFYSKGKNPVKPHEEKGEALAKNVLTSEEDTIPGGIGESFSSIMNNHGDVDNVREWATKANTPLTQLVASIDQMEAFVSPRGYKKGNNPNIKTSKYKGIPEKAFGWQAIEDRFDFPNEVRKALGDHYAEYYKRALEKRTGTIIPDGDWNETVGPVQQQVLYETPLGKYYEYKRQNTLENQEAIKNTTELLGAKAEKDVINSIDDTSKNDSSTQNSKHQIRTDVYDKYNSAYPDTGMSSDFRKTIGFLLSTVGIDPSTIKAKVIENGDPEVLKQSLINFNNNFQTSDQDSNKKEAIQFVTDNWDNLTSADKAYFKSKIERDNRDYIKNQQK